MFKKPFLFSSALFLTLPVFAAEPDIPPYDVVEDVCSHVAEHRGDLGDITIQSGFLNINNDDNPKPEEIIHRTQGTAHFPSLSYKTFHGKEIEVEQKNFDLKDFWAFGTFWLPYRANYFVGAKSEDGKYLSYLSYINPKNEEYWLCKFKNNVNVTLYSDSQDSPVCDAVRDRNITFISGSREKDFDADVQGPFFSRVKETVAVDFDNDGDEDKLVRVNQASSAGRGCDADFFVHSSSNGSYSGEHDKTVLYELQNMDPNDAYPLRGDRVTYCHGNIAEWFKFEGKSYLVFKFEGDQPRDSNDELYWVGVIENGKARRVCKSLFSIKHEVSGFSKEVLDSFPDKADSTER